MRPQAIWGAICVAALSLVAGLSSVAPVTGQNGAASLAPLAQLAPPAAAQVELGRHLFFDKRLSGDASLSCASCHNPEHAYTDAKPLAAGYPGTLYFRNAPSVINAAHKRTLTWDGRLSGSDLETQVRDAITETHSMNMDGRLMLERLKQVPEYVRMFQEAFGENAEPSFGRTLKAIAAFERSLVSTNVAFDRFVGGDTGALSLAAKQGYELFVGKARCVTCHNGPMLTDWTPHRLDVPDNPEIFKNPERHLTFRAVFKALGVPNYTNLRTDVGRYTVSKQHHDRGRFVTPSLREIGRTAPYMHNGTLTTLADVVAFYSKGGGPNSELGAPLNLSAAEQSNLVAFLESLTGDALAIETPPTYSYRKIADWREGGDKVTFAPEAAPPATATTGGDASALLVKYTCTACHTLSGQRLVGPSFKGLWGAQRELEDGTSVVVDANYLRESITDPNAKVVKGFPPAMPPDLAGRMSADEIDRIITFIKTLR